VTNGDGVSGNPTVTNSGVTSIAGTSDQITASASTGGVTLSLPSTINVNTTGSAGSVTGNATGSTFGFDSGYGSVATAYGCRAWVNFNGTGTVAIRASGNVSSITDGGTGIYTVNFTNAMPNANYSAVFGADGISGTEYRSNVGISSQAAGSLQIKTGVENTSGANQIQDRAIVCVAIFR
jgi:hypothetical protein